MPVSPPSARSSGRDVAPGDIVDSIVSAFQAEYAGVARVSGCATGSAAASTPASAPARTQAPAPRGPQRADADRAQAGVDQDAAKMGPEYTALHSLVKDEGLHTVCQEAGCPNIYECWEDREATFLIGGSQCTRRCDFCQIDTGKPADYDTDEPRRVAESVAADAAALRDGHRRRARRPARRAARGCMPRPSGASTPRTPAPASRSSRPTSTGNPALLREVFESRPEVFAHNVETVPRIFKRIRPAFRYERSLDVITQARDFGLITKSNLILGMGEEPEEVVQALQDLHDAGTDIITITQYLRPVAAASAGGPLGQAARSSSSSRRRPSASGSSACSPARSCARRIAPGGCGRSR